MAENKMYNRKEFAKKLGICADTLKAWERQGFLKPLRKPSGRPFYTDEDYNDFVETCKKKE